MPLTASCRLCRVHQTAVRHTNQMVWHSVQHPTCYGTCHCQASDEFEGRRLQEHSPLCSCISIRHRLSPSVQEPPRSLCHPSQGRELCAGFTVASELLYCTKETDVAPGQSCDRSGGAAGANATCTSTYSGTASCCGCRCRRAWCCGDPGGPPARPLCCCRGCTCEPQTKEAPHAPDICATCLLRESSRAQWPCPCRWHNV
jgi:hypothetical protein